MLQPLTPDQFAEIFGLVALPESIFPQLFVERARSGSLGRKAVA